MTATRLHCEGDCRLTDGGEIYPHREDFADKPITDPLFCPKQAALNEVPW